MIYTSYAAALKYINKTKYTCLAITHFSLGLKEYTALCPPFSIVKKLKETNDIKEFVESYYAFILKKLDVNQVHRDLIDYCKPKIPVLVCLEKPDKFCHRKVVKEWFNSYNIDCEELKVETKKRKLKLNFKINIEDL